MLLIAAFGFVVGCAACQPPPGHPVYPPQIEGTIHFEGDSVTWNTYWDTGVSYIGTSGQWLPGDRVDVSPWSGHPTLERLPKDLAAGQVDELLWALGLNEIGSQHAWTVQHQLMWYDMLINYVPPATCVVIVKPWVLPMDYPNRPLSAINALRAWIDNFAANRPNTVVVDWKPVLETHPEFSPEDGVHLEPGMGGAEARDAMYREGLARCAT